MRAAVVIVLAFAAVGCGDQPRITGEDKERIATAALTLSRQCIGGEPDVSAVEDSATTLLDARDEFGDQRFTINEQLADITIQDLIDRIVAVMEAEDCAPEQRDRLS